MQENINIFKSDKKYKFQFIEVYTMRELTELTEL